MPLATGALGDVEMKKLLCILLILCSQCAFAKIRPVDIEIALCDQLPKNKIYGCLMKIRKPHEHHR
jgi:hypothetical protein